MKERKKITDPTYFSGTYSQNIKSQYNDLNNTTNIPLVPLQKD